MKTKRRWLQEEDLPEIESQFRNKIKSMNMVAETLPSMKKDEALDLIYRYTTQVDKLFLTMKYFIKNYPGHNVANYLMMEETFQESSHLVVLELLITKILYDRDVICVIEDVDDSYLTAKVLINSLVEIGVVDTNCPSFRTLLSNYEYMKSEYDLLKIQEWYSARETFLTSIDIIVSSVLLLEYEALNTHMIDLRMLAEKLEIKGEYKNVFFDKKTKISIFQYYSRTNINWVCNPLTSNTKEIIKFINSLIENRFNKSKSANFIVFSHDSAIYNNHTESALIRLCDTFGVILETINSSLEPEHNQPARSEKLPL